MTMEGIKIRLRNYYIRATATGRQKELKNTDFTIISNNCWGGLVYESYDLPKQTPTVGMYFMAEEYIRFVSDLKYYLCDCKMMFIPPEEARHKSFYKQDSHFGAYPIARVGDVEIACLHYHSEEEALAKWERRCERVNWSRMIVKMNDQNGCTEEDALTFGRLPYENKLFFTVKGLDAGACTIRVANAPYRTILSTEEPFGASRKINVTEFINSL